MTATLMTETQTGYKQTKLGWIPEEWEVVRLSEISAKIMVGIASSATHAYRDSGIVLIRNQNIKNGYLDDSDLLFIDSGYELAHKNKRLQAGDLLTARTGYPGATCVVPEKYENAQSFTTLITRPLHDLVLNAYLSFYINSSFGKSFFDRSQIGGGQKNVNSSTLATMPIPLPPLPEQQRIAAILGTWDRAIGQLEDLLAAKETQLKGLMQRLLTGAVRLAGFEGAWEEVRLGQILKESKDVGLGADPSMRLTVKLNLKGVTNRAVRGTEVEGATIYYRRKAGQFIYGKQNLHKGALGLIPSEYDGYESSSDIPSFDFKAGYDPTYFVMYVSRPNFYEHLEVLATGTGSKRIKPRVLLKKTVNIPTLKEQKAIAGVLSAGQTELQLLYQKLAGLREQQRGLMARLLTGAVRV